jgi:hypothetical protein
MNELHENFGGDIHIFYPNSPGSSHQFALSQHTSLNYNTRLVIHITSHDTHSMRSSFPTENLFHFNTSQAFTHHNACT